MKEDEIEVELLFADNLNIVQTSEQRIEENLQLWQRKLKKRGLKMNKYKTVVMKSAKQGGRGIKLKKTRRTVERSLLFQVLMYHNICNCRMYTSRERFNNS